MNNFAKCVEVVLKHEGGYVNHPDDPGGETNFGIAKRFYPDLDIKKLTRAEAEKIYYRDYWKKAGLDRILRPQRALQVFDMGVNAGTKRSIKMAQAVVRVQRDGILGPVTAAAINRSQDFEERFVRKRVEYYVGLVKRKPQLQVFLVGWIMRVITTKI